MSNHQSVPQNYEEALKTQLQSIMLGGTLKLKDHCVASIFASLPRQATKTNCANPANAANPVSTANAASQASPSINIILDFDAKQQANKANQPQSQQGLSQIITAKNIKSAEAELTSSMQKIIPNAKINVAIVANFIKPTKPIAQIPAQKQTRQAKPIKQIQSISGVKHVIMVGSGKGGVGKTSVAIGLAKGLQKLGHSVAIADADILGSSVPILFGNQAHRQKMSSNGNMLNPVMCNKIQLSSVAFLIGSEAALMWRGSMVSKSVLQVVTQTKWNKVDYLIIDTPPSTGDTHLTLMQNIKIDGALLVSTSNKASAAGVIRLAKMLDMMKVKSIGAIENMRHNCNNGSANNGNTHNGTKNGDAPKRGDWSIETCLKAIDLNIIAEIPMMPDIFSQGDASQLYNCQNEQFANIAKYVVEFCKKTNKV